MKTWFLVAAVHAVLVGGAIGAIAAERHNEMKHGSSDPAPLVTPTPAPVADPDPSSEPGRDGLDETSSPTPGASRVTDEPSTGGPTAKTGSRDGGRSVYDDGPANGPGYCLDSAEMYTEMYKDGDLTPEDYDLLMQEIEDVCQ